MNYTFPIIKHINDVLPHVQGREEFSVMVKGSYTVINYNLMTNDTFRPFTGEDDLGNAIRRECRGIIFDTATGDLIRRPYHKFFNIGEREETLPDNVNLFNEHIIMDKLDGSMIAPFITSDGVFHWGTKAGETDTSAQVLPFIDENVQYLKFAVSCIKRGFTPIFEWMSADNRIVISYGEPRLVLTAIRSMENGLYLATHDMVNVGRFWQVETVDYKRGFNSTADILVQNVSKMPEIEGFVVRFDDGHMVKVKTEWYLAIHKAKDNLLYERRVIEMILNEQLDDVIPFLPEWDRKRVEDYRDAFIHWYNLVVGDVAFASHHALVDKAMDRKTFALEKSKMFGAYASIIFRHFDQIKTLDVDKWHAICREQVKQLLLNCCNSNSKLESSKQSLQWDQRIKW